jgi:hypothetical protein
MNLTALMLARNEQKNIGLTARVALMWCDNIIIGLHACEDKTSDIVGQIWAENPVRVFPVELGNGPWDEMDHRQKLLDEAREIGSTHCAIVDADEVLTGNLLGVIRDIVDTLNPRECLQVPGFAMWCSIDKFRVDGEFNRNIRNRGSGFSLAFRDDPMLCWRPRGNYQHHRRHPFASEPTPKPLMAFGGVMHLQYVRWREFRAKQAHYQMMELLRWPEQGTDLIKRKYTWWTSMQPVLHDAIPEWWRAYADLMDYADFSDGEGWHEREINRLIEEHGREYFAGLDLFGVA